MLTRKHKIKKNKTLKHKIYYLFFYGSAINDISRENTIKRKSNAIPVIISKAFGYKRRYNFKGANQYNFGKTKKPIIVLGIEKSKDALPVNGIIIKVNSNELRNFDKRELAYNRIKIPWKYVNTYYKNDLIKIPTQPLYVYKTSREKIIHKNNHYLSSNIYIDTTLAGLGKYGYKMVQQFFTTTIGLPREIDTYNKWKKHKDKRATECLIAAHYARQV